MFEDTTPGEAVAGNVKTLMRLRGIETHQELADRMTEMGFTNWERRTVGRILTDSRKRNLKVDEVFALALALQTTVEQLLTPGLEQRMAGRDPDIFMVIGSTEAIPVATYTKVIRDPDLDSEPDGIPEITIDGLGQWQIPATHGRALFREGLSRQLAAFGVTVTDEMTLEDIGALVDKTQKELLDET